MKPIISRLPIGGGRFVEVSTELFFGHSMSCVTCFCGYQAPRNSDKEVAVDWIVDHINKEHPEALADFAALRQRERSEKSAQALLFLQGSPTILSGTTNPTPREETMGRYTRKKGITRGITNPSNPVNVAKRVGRRTPLPEPSKSEGADQMESNNHHSQGRRSRTIVGPSLLKFLIERTGERVFVQDILDHEDFKDMDLNKKVVQSGILTLINSGEPIRVVHRGHIWVFDPTYRPPMVSRIMERAGEEQNSANLETQSMVVLSRKRDLLVLLDPSGKIWKAEPLHM